MADGAPIPLVYGLAQVGCKPFVIDYEPSTETWVVGYTVALGEITSYQTIYVNGTDGSTITGLTITEYLGTTSQTTDSTISGAVSGYGDNLVISDPDGDIGVAYVVLEYTNSVFQDWPEVIAEIEGRKCLSPGVGTIYTDNPALHLGDLLSNTQYGLGVTVDSTALGDARDYCDDLITTVSPNVKRRTSYAVLDRVQNTDQWVEVLRAYASCWVVYRADTAYLIPDKPGASIKTFTASDILADSFRIDKKDSSQLPTAIRAYFTDTSGTKWRDVLSNAAQIVTSPMPEYRESRIRLPFCTNHGQAKRECIERLDKLWLADDTYTFTAFDEAQEVEAGDIITITHPYGPTNELVRVISDPVQIGPGRWEITAIEYDAAAYDDTVDAGPTYGDSDLPNGGVPSSPASLSVQSDTFETADGFWRSRLYIEWTAPADGSLVSHYQVTVTAPTSPETIVYHSLVGSETLKAVTAAIAENISYTVDVSAVNSIIVGPPISTAHNLVPAANTPGSPTGLTVQTTGLDIFAKWNSVTDAVKYEARYWAGGGSWATGTELDDVYGLSLAAQISAGSYTLGVRAKNSVGDESGTATQAFATSATSNIETFYQGLTTDGIPTASAAGSLWYDTDDNQHPYRAAVAGANEVGVSPEEWVSVKDTNLYNQVDLSYVAIDATVRVASFTAVAQTRYTIDTQTGTSPETDLQMTLPASPSIGQQVYFFDANGHFDIVPFFIMRNGSNIMGETNDIECNIRFFSGGLQYVSAAIGWQVI
jgi:hypothetical protein